MKQKLTKIYTYRRSRLPNDKLQFKSYSKNDISKIGVTIDTEKYKVAYLCDEKENMNKLSHSDREKSSSFPTLSR